MPTLTIKKLPLRVHQRLKQRAAQRRRSINKEAIECLERALMSTPIDPEEFLARVRERRKTLSRVWVTEKDLKRAKEWGRL
jgi:plasmid stability protein